MPWSARCAAALPFALLQLLLGCSSAADGPNSGSSGAGQGGLGQGGLGQGGLGQGGLGQGGLPGGGSAGKAGNGGASGAGGGTAGKSSGQHPTDGAVWATAPITVALEEIVVRCPADTHALAGGCDCGPGGNIRSSTLAGANGWVCSCQEPGSGATAHAYCLPQDFPVETSSVDLEEDGSKSRAVCRPGQVSVAAGISCYGSAGANVVATSGVLGANGIGADGQCLGSPDGVVISYCAPAAQADALELSAQSVALDKSPQTFTCSDGASLQYGFCQCPSGTALDVSAPGAPGEWRCDCGTAPLSGAGSAALVCKRPS